jgi:hypothetical protein
MVLAGAALSALARPAGAQRLTATEVGLGAAVAAARYTFAGVEAGLAYRPGGQSRVALAVAAGTAAGRTAGRAQLTLQFLVTPAARRGVGLYAGLGAALAARQRSAGAGFVAVLVGLEGAQGRRRGWQNWYLELGLGGGVRAAAGWRVRSFPSWWRGR